jgi:hypothetical protein
MVFTSAGGIGCSFALSIQRRASLEVSAEVTYVACSRRSLGHAVYPRPSWCYDVHVALGGTRGLGLSNWLQIRLLDVVVDAQFQKNLLSRLVMFLCPKECESSGANSCLRHQELSTSIVFFSHVIYHMALHVTNMVIYKPSRIWWSQP